MKILFVEDFPHGSDDESGFMAYEYAKKHPLDKVLLITTHYTRECISQLPNLDIKKIFPKSRNFDIFFLDCGAYDFNTERMIDPLGLPCVTFSLLNTVDKTPLFEMERVINATIDKLTHIRNKYHELQTLSTN